MTAPTAEPPTGGAPHTLALTRGISGGLGRCELTHLERTPIDLERARAQHRAYSDALRSTGCQVVELAASEEHPDCVFIEDAAVVFDELAVITRPGAASRRGETAAVEAALRPHRPLVRIAPPGTLDGGDVLVLGRSVFVGLSTRSNAAGVDQLRSLLALFGYRVAGLDVRACLHLKTAATAIDERTALVNPAMLDPTALPDVECIAVHPDEPFAANVVSVAGTLLHGAEHPRTRERLEARGHRVVALEADEVAKAEGALTCCSLLVPMASRA